MRKRSFALLGVLALCESAGICLSDECEPPPPPPARPSAAYSPHQQSFTVGGGAADFIRDRISDHTSVAGTWNARYLLGTRSLVGFEATYMGSDASVNASRVDNGSVSTTQFSGNFRFNATRSRIQPFATGGVGWEMLHRTGTGIVGLSTFSHTTYSVVTPFSAGLTGYLGRHTVAELRGTYNLITSKDFALGGARPDLWSGELRFGYAF